MSSKLHLLGQDRDLGSQLKRIKRDNTVAAFKRINSFLIGLCIACLYGLVAYGCALENTVRVGS